MGYKGVLARLSSITAWSVQDDDPVNNQIVGVGLTTPKHYYVPDLERTGVLTPNHDESSNRNTQLPAGHILPEETTRIGYSVLRARRIPPQIAIAPKMTSPTRNRPRAVSFFPR